MKQRLSFLLLLLLCSIYPSELLAQWHADSLPGYSQRSLQMQADYAGAVTATLVRHHREAMPARRALLYVHGYNDYFFQAALGDSIAQHGIDFYALDLRKYGTVPHGGFGIGIERMVTFAAGTKHIREAIPFPRMLHRIKP